MIKRKLTALGILLCLFSSSVVFAQADRGAGVKATGEKRLALVIGNGASQHTSPLPNPTNDATDMATTLKTLGFEVIEGTNQTKLQMENLIRQFGNRLRDSKGVGLVFYAGHGIQADGANYLIPVDADIKEEDIIVGMSVTNSLGMKLMGVPAGTFQMGSIEGDDDEKIHTVTLSRGFYMGRTEVTQGEWKAVMGSLPSAMSALGQEFLGDKKPVVLVSWEEVQEFIRKLNAKGEGTYRLPTEAEWEYAARAGTTGDHAGNLDSMAWYNKNSGNKMHEVATKQANGWGLYDMHGNVWEWVQDWYGDYSSSAQINPTGATSGSDRVTRGGGWSSYAVYARSAVRYESPPSYQNGHLGFRVVRN